MAWRVCSHFKSDRPTGFLLTDRCAIAVYPPAAASSTRMATTSQPAKLTVDRQIEHGESRGAAFDLGFVRIDQTCLGRSGGFAPINCPCSGRGLDFQQAGFVV
jgi:hypothetical protein